MIGECTTLSVGGGAGAAATRRMLSPMAFRNTRNTPPNVCGPWMYRTRPALLLPTDGNPFGGSVLHMFTCMDGCAATQPGEFQHQVKSPLPLPDFKCTSMSGMKKVALDFSPKKVGPGTGMNVEPWKTPAWCAWMVIDAAAPPVITSASPFSGIGPFGKLKPTSLVCESPHGCPAGRL